MIPPLRVIGAWAALCVAFLCFVGSFVDIVIQIAHGNERTAAVGIGLLALSGLIAGFALDILDAYYHPEKKP